jgi:hypothetical protein
VSTAKSPAWGMPGVAISARNSAALASAGLLAEAGEGGARRLTASGAALGAAAKAAAGVCPEARAPDVAGELGGAIAQWVTGPGADPRATGGGAGRVSTGPGADRRASRNEEGAGPGAREGTPKDRLELATGMGAKPARGREAVESGEAAPKAKVGVAGAGGMVSAAEVGGAAPRETSGKATAKGAKPKPW